MAKRIRIRHLENGSTVDTVLPEGDLHVVVLGENDSLVNVTVMRHSDRKSETIFSVTVKTPDFKFATEQVGEFHDLNKS